MKNVFWLLRNCLVFVSSIAIPPVNCRLICTAHWGWGWGGRVLTQSGTGSCSGSGPGLAEVIAVSWGKRMGASSPPAHSCHSPCRARPLSSVTISSLQQQVEKGGVRGGMQRPDLFSPSLHFFFFSKCCCAKCLKLCKYESI